MRDSIPHELLTDDAFALAHSGGYRVANFRSMNKRVVRRILCGQPLVGEDAGSREVFNRSLGGTPKLLPASLVFYPNPVLHCGCQNAFARFEHMVQA
jgi:hypothetical protein